jgi:hypothetical protein
MRDSRSAGSLAAVPSSNRELKKELKAVEPKHLAAVWPTIRAEALEIESPDNIAEDCYAACKSGQATLFLLFVDGERVGFTILKRIDDDLHIWQTYAKNGYDVLTVFRADLYEMARKGGMTKLTFGTIRQGFEKVAPHHGFRKRMTIWEADV